MVIEPERGFRRTDHHLYARIAKQIKMPEKFRCQNCGYLKDLYDEEFLEWTYANGHADQSDISNYLLAPVLACKCVDSAAEVRKRIVDNLSNANLPLREDAIGPRTFDNFDLTIPNAEGIFRPIAEWTEGKGSPVLVLAGITGCGKTHLMEASARVLLHDGHSVRYEIAGVFLDRLRATFGDSEQSIQGIFDDMDRYDRLFLDELDEASEWGTPRITRIVNKRIDDGRRLMIATNHVAPASMASAFDHRLASRVFDRNTGVVRVVWPKTGDYRMRRI